MPYGMDYLKRKLSAKASRVELRYKYYEQKNNPRDMGITIPPRLKAQYASAFGWCAKAVDSVADRLCFRGFKEDNFGIMEVFNYNNPDVFFDSAILGALISSCDFVYISMDENDYPKLQVIDGANATGIIDERTGMLKEGYAVIERDDKGNPSIEAYFEPGRTTYYYKDSDTPEVFNNIATYPLLVPIIHRPDAKRPFGHSRISRACMDYQNAAMRTLTRSEVSAEFYSVPQRYVTGMSEDAEPFEKWKATVSSMLRFDKDDDGDKPELGQFPQQSMSPFTEQLRTIASLFGGETGLTLDDLGFVSDNPSSSEAIKAAHENLRLAARKAQHSFENGFLNVGFLCAQLRDNKPYKRRMLYQTKGIWEPIFEPDAAALGLIGDGAQKINTAVPGYFNADNLRELTGIDPTDGDVEF